MIIHPAFISIIVFKQLICPNSLRHDIFINQLFRMHNILIHLTDLPSKPAQEHMRRGIWLLKRVDRQPYALVTLRVYHLLYVWLELS